MTCPVCGVGNGPEDNRSCERESCSWALSNRASMGEASFQSLRLKAKRALEKKQARSQMYRAFETEDHMVWSEAVSHSRYTTEQLPLLQIPSGKTQATAVPSKRRQAFQHHLENIVGKAFEDEQIPQSAYDSAERKASAALSTPFLQTCCRLCGGGCCSGGGDHAHLSEESITEYRALYPQKSQAEVLKAYNRYIPKRSMAGSCIMHSPTGCTLPRRIRSRTCNEYLCTGVKQWLKKTNTNPQVRGGYVIQRQLDNVSWPGNRDDNKIIATHLIWKP